MDYHPRRHGLPCGPQGSDSDRCWYSALTQVVSTDGGNHFTAPSSSTARFVAGAPYQFDEHHEETVGALVPTQMVRWNGYVYSLFSMKGTRDQAEGDCLVRTENPADPSSWRAWNGREFAVTFVDPYPTPPSSPQEHTCQPVGQGSLRSPVRSLLSLPHRQGFIAVMAGGPDEGSNSDDVLASTSADLIHWSKPVTVLKGLPAYRPNSANCDIGPHPTAYYYPSLIDPGSYSLTFDTLSSSRVYIYISRFHMCEGSNRDLIRIPVSVTYGN
jgi:hypothetical protein